MSDPLRDAWQELGWELLKTLPGIIKYALAVWTVFVVLLFAWAVSR